MEEHDPPKGLHPERCSTRERQLAYMVEAEKQAPDRDSGDVELVSVLSADFT